MEQSEKLEETLFQADRMVCAKLTAESNLGIFEAGIIRSLMYGNIALSAVPLSMIKLPPVHCGLKYQMENSRNK